MVRTKGLKLGKQAVVWVLALIAIMACVALAACSSGGTAASSPASSDAESSAVEETSAAEEAAPAEEAEETSAAEEAVEEEAVEEEPAEEPAAEVGEPMFDAPTTIPEADEFGVITHDKWADQYPLQVGSYLQNANNVPGAAGEYEEITASEPDETSAGLENKTVQSSKANFLADDQYPEIKVIGKGYGYAKYYTEPGGHTYSVWSIEHNGRLGDVRGGGTAGILACYACKTPHIHFDAENKGGAEAWYLGDVSEHAKEVGVELKTKDDGSEIIGWRQSATNGAGVYTENVSCANCHVNDNPTEFNIIRADWKRVMGKAWESNSLDIPQSAMVCGQCHCDYSMALTNTTNTSEGNDPEQGDPEYSNGEPTSPYEADTDGTLSNITPEKALQFYDEHKFADWTYASTGAKMLSIRHAEFEIYYVMDGGSTMRTMGYNCADCHMPTKVDEGTAYTSHMWTSPLDDEELVAQCDTCHSAQGGVVEFVKGIQAEIDGRNHELGMRYADFIHNFESKVATMQKPEGSEDEVLMLDKAFAEENGIDAETLAKLQKIQRDACYWWNLPAADNSEGAHNRALYTRCLDVLEQLLDEGDEILGMESSAANFEAWNAEQAKAA